jgi:four helix bundle protein
MCGREDAERRGCEDAKTKGDETMAFRYESLQIWPMTLEYVDACFIVADGLPQRIQFSIAEQLRRAATLIVANIAEGSAKSTLRSERNSYDIARGSLAETVGLLTLCQRRRYLDADRHQRLYNRANVVSSMLQGLIKANDSNTIAEVEVTDLLSNDNLEEFFASSPYEGSTPPDFGDSFASSPAQLAPSPLAHTYPITLTNLSDAPVVVVGGGPVGARKIKGLLAMGAAVRLVSPAATEELRDLAAGGRIAWTQREYVAGDLGRARLVFAATNQRAVNAAVASDAAADGILCNVADAPDEGSFHLPAVYRGAQATIAVSTSGVNPAGAKQLRDRIARWIEEQR